MELEHALDDLRAIESDPQRVYSCLVRVHEVLATQPPQALVNGVVSRADTVALLQELLRLHLHQEEIQWCLCRVLTLGCSLSVRFQCQAGRLELWNDIFELRSAHPASTRVLESSLELYEALLRANELHVINARPAQRLIEEMLATIDRFSGQGGSRAARPEMVVGAVRVLTAVYASPRVHALVEEKNTRFAAAIVARLLATSATFFSSERDVTLYLRMCRRMVQQHRVAAVSGLFLATLSPDTQTPWFTSMLEKWATKTLVVCDFAALLTLVFALPHELGDALVESLASELLREQRLLRTMCELLGRYCREPAGDESAARTRLEVVRAIRQWSAAGATLKVFAGTAQVPTLLVPTLVQLLQSAAEQLQQLATMPPPSSLPHQTLQLVLEAAMLLQQLPSQAAAGPSSALTPSVLLQMRSDLAALQAAKAVTAASRQRDTDLDALVTRELTKLERILRQRASTPANTKASLKQLAGSKQSSRPSPSSSKLPLCPVARATSSRQSASSSLAVRTPKQSTPSS